MKQLLYTPQYSHQTSKGNCRMRGMSFVIVISPSSRQSHLPICRRRHQCRSLLTLLWWIVLVCGYACLVNNDNDFSFVSMSLVALLLSVTMVSYTTWNRRRRKWAQSEECRLNQMKREMGTESHWISNHRQSCCGFFFSCDVSWSFDWKIIMKLYSSVWLNLFMINVCICIWSNDTLGSFLFFLHIFDWYIVRIDFEVMLDISSLPCHVYVQIVLL